MPADFGQYLWDAFVANERTYTMLLTMLVLGCLSFTFSVLPRWQEEEIARAREEEAARAIKPTPAEELRKAA